MKSVMAFLGRASDLTLLGKSVKLLETHANVGQFGLKADLRDFVAASLSAEKCAVYAKSA